MAHYLKDGHLEVHFANDAIEGLTKLRDSGDFDLLVSDVMMPEMNGMEFIQHINGFYPTLPIIVCSSGGDSISNGLTASELMDLALERGACKALKKPFSKSDLLRVINEVSNIAA
jgi:CheY-like chemotaxis protein